MHSIELRATINKNGKLYARNKGIQYPNLDDAQCAYVMAKAAEIATHLQVLKAGNGEYAVTLEADVDGKPVAAPVVKSGLTLSQWLDIESHMIDIQRDMHTSAVRLLRSAGKL
jgi:hypothetical protein